MQDALAPRPAFPIMCFDERPCVLHGQHVEPLPAQLAHSNNLPRLGGPRWASNTICMLKHGLPAGRLPGTRQLAGAGFSSPHWGRLLPLYIDLAANYPQTKKSCACRTNSIPNLTLPFTRRRGTRPGGPLRGALPTEKYLLAGDSLALGHPPTSTYTSAFPSLKSLPPTRHLCGGTQCGTSHGKIAVYSRRGSRRTRPTLSKN